MSAKLTYQYTDSNIATACLKSQASTKMLQILLCIDDFEVRHLHESVNLCINYILEVAINI